MPLPQHRPFAGAGIDQHHRELISRAFNSFRTRNVNADAGEAGPGEFAEVIVSEPADVAGAPSKGGADADRGRRLAPGHSLETLEPLFRVARRVFRDHGDEIDTVEAKADDVESGRCGRFHGKRQTHAGMLAADRWFRLSSSALSG